MMNREQLIRICLDSGVVRRDVAIKLIETIEANERKACAKICRTYAKETEYYGDDNAEYCFKLAEKTIKERGQQ